MPDSQLKDRPVYSSISVDFVARASLKDARCYGSNTLLAVVQYGKPNDALSHLECPVISLAIPQLDETDKVEVWTSSATVITGQSNNIRYSADGQLLIGVFQIAESDAFSFERLTYEGYTEILEFLESRGYPHLLRIWNHFSGINSEENGLERYRSFCMGRYQAYAEHDPEFEKHLPAASGTGAKEKIMTLYFIASQESGIPIENPRQTSAYHYPLQYGVRSPSFSRAIIKEFGGQRQLLISGTASIVGHESRHQGDVEGQLGETLSNIDALLEHTRTSQGIDFCAGENKPLYKVYIRNSDDYPLISQKLNNKLGDRASIMYLNADICRSDLLVEIEAIYTV
ncbi:MAG: pteridine-dependent deoxygenase [Gammaproteobacteria bacterium]|nr:MAG: pteridine-dependent deoxygenase [Gammaproteobacteria bacterium]